MHLQKIANPLIIKIQWNMYDTTICQKKSRNNSPKKLIVCYKYNILKYIQRNYLISKIPKLQFKFKNKMPC